MNKNQATTIGIRLQDADGALLGPSDIGFASGEVQLIEFTAAPTGGYCTISDGTHTTDQMAFDADAAGMLAAMQMAGIAAASVSGSYGVGFTVTFTTAAGDAPLLSVNASGLVVGEGGTVDATVTTTTQAVVNVTVSLQKDGGEPTSATNPVHAAGAAMSLALTASETNCDTLQVTVTATGAIPREYVFSPRTEPTSLDAAGVRAAVGLVAANLDTQINSVGAAVLTRLAASAYTAAPTAADNVAALATAGWTSTRAAKLDALDDLAEIAADASAAAASAASAVTHAETAADQAELATTAATAATAAALNAKAAALAAPAAWFTTADTTELENGLTWGKATRAIAAVMLGDCTATQAGADLAYAAANNPLVGRVVASGVTAEGGRSVEIIEAEAE